MLTAAGTWTDLGGGARVRQSRAFAMNTVLLLAEHTVLIDPGVLPSELEELAETVREEKPRQVTLIFTHAHWDHVLGRPFWPEAAAVGHVRLASELVRDRRRIQTEAESMAARAGERWARGFQPFEPDLAVSGGQTARLGPWMLGFRDAPGHSDSQLCVHVPERRLLIAADMLSDLEIPMLAGPVSVYRQTLEALRPLIEGGEVERMVPGHGSVAKGAEAALERLDRDLAYLQALESGVQSLRAARATLEQAVEKLAAMDYLGKRAEYSMADAHRDNIKAAWEGLGAPRRPA